MPEERNRKISIQLASQCAPTFLRVKPSSLMMLCPEDTEAVSYTHLTLPTNSRV